jgi:ABC-type Fe3+-citrate transport system substrate-binding protein
MTMLTNMYFLLQDRIEHVHTISALFAFEQEEQQELEQEQQELEQEQQELEQEQE